MSDSLYSEPALYRALFRERTQDVAFYADVCAGARSVLELGAGEGRVSVALAERGHAVTAVERSAEMLAALVARGGGVTAVQGDMRTVRLDARFDRVLVPFNGVAHLHADGDLRALLDTARAHLAEGGCVALDVLVPDPRLYEGGGATVPRVEHPRTGAVCRLEERYVWDPPILTIRTELTERLSGDTQVLELSLRQREPEELEAALVAHGWTVERREDLGDAVGFVAAPEGSAQPKSV